MITMHLSQKSSRLADIDNEVSTSEFTVTLLAEKPTFDIKLEHKIILEGERAYVCIYSIF